MSDVTSPTDPHAEREALEASIQILVKEHARLMNRLAGDSGQALLGGTGRINIQHAQDGSVQVGLEFFGGWVVTRFSAADKDAIAEGFNGAAPPPEDGA